MVVSAFLVAGVFVFVQQTSANAQGLTVTPATATLSLAKDEAAQTSTLTITNNYAVPVVLHFSFAAPQHASSRDRQAVETLSVASPEVTLAPAASFAQTITVQASDKLAPGSQQAVVVITQAAVAGRAVGVLPELRLPLILVKEDGALTSLSLASIGRPAVAITPPKTIDVTLNNTGNMVAIPRGFVMVTAPGGKVLGKGALNTASAALNAGSSATYTTKITPLSGALLPGPYHIFVSYGLGGDQAAKTGSTRFVFVAWWHVVGALALIAGAYCASHYAIPAYLKRKRSRHRAQAKAALVTKEQA